MAFRTHWGGGQPPSPLPWLARTPMLLSSRECCILAVVGITACTHLLPKTAIKLPFRQQICLFQDTNSPFLTTKSPETATKSPFLVACFRIQSCRFRQQVCRFRQQVWTGLKRRTDGNDWPVDDLYLINT